MKPPRRQPPMWYAIAAGLALVLADPTAPAFAGETATSEAKTLPSAERVGDPAPRPHDAGQRRFAAHDEADLQRSRRAVGAMQRADPGLKRLFDEAIGYAVFSEIGASDGPGAIGVLYEEGQAAGRATLRIPPASLQTGSQPYSLVVFFGTRHAVAVVPGRTTRFRYIAGVSAFTFGGSGGANGASPPELAFGYLPYHRDISSSPR